MRKGLILLMFLITISSVFAADFEIGSNVIDDDILSNETAAYEVMLGNNGPSILQVSIYTTDINWDLTTDPLTDRNVKVYPFSQKDTLIKLKPSATVASGLYGIPVTFAPEGEEPIKQIFYVDLTSAEEIPADYVPAIRATIQADSEIDPQKEYVVKLFIENLNPRNIEELDVTLLSDILEKEETISLAPLEKKTLEYKIKLNPLTPPKDIRIKAFLQTEADNKMYRFDAETTPTEIIPTGGIEEKIATTSEFLKETNEYTYTNNGNTPNTYALTVSANILARLHLTAVPEPEIVEINGKKMFQWNVELDVGEIKKITVTANYRPFFYTILTILIIAAIYFAFRSPLVVRKSATITRSKGGGITEIAIRLHVKNRGFTALDKVHLKDKAPHIVEVIKQFKMGTIHPEKIIRNEKRGTILTWDIGKLDKHEERIITYSAKSNLSIVGGIDLPQALASCHKRRVRSNKITINA